MATSILIGDDHPAILKGLTNYFKTRVNLDVVDTGINGQEILDKYQKHKPDVVILDISMPVLNGYETAKKILTTEEKANILFYSVNLSRSEIYSGYQLGGKGFISKGSELDVFEEAINEIIQGKLYFDDVFTEKHLEEYNESISFFGEKTRQLTLREKDVLAFAALGMKNQEISQKLFISVKTIEFHRNNIRKKLGLIGSAEFLKFAIEFSKES